MTGNDKIPHVIIAGCGFGGLNAARKLAPHAVRITVIDRSNHHTFQPLLYQVATAGLASGDIAYPIRHILRAHKNVSVIMGDVIGFDLEKRLVKLEGLDLDYDFLIVATGATHSYLAHPEWEQYAPGLKTIEDAGNIRNRVLLTYERAERDQITCGRHKALNFVVVGAGPTGVELAGALAEISRQVLIHDFRHIDPAMTRVVLVEYAPYVLPSYSAELSEKARRRLEKMGVEVRTSTLVTSIEPGLVRTRSDKDGEEAIPSAVTLWAAGVKASAVGAMLGAPLDKAGRVIVEQDLSIPGHPEIFVIGDLAAFKEKTASGERMLPGVAQVAMQGGRTAAKNILRTLHGRPRVTFRYFDKGNMASIGRAAAILERGKLRMSGFIAWIAWLFIHVMYLIGFRNRIMVMLKWAWAYIRFEKTGRLIYGGLKWGSQSD